MPGFTYFLEKDLYFINMELHKPYYAVIFYFPPETKADHGYNEMAQTDWNYWLKGR